MSIPIFSIVRKKIEKNFWDMEIIGNRRKRDWSQNFCRFSIWNLQQFLWFTRTIFLAEVQNNFRNKLPFHSKWNKAIDFLFISVKLYLKLFPQTYWQTAKNIIFIANFALVHISYCTRMSEFHQNKSRNTIKITW